MLTLPPVVFPDVEAWAIAYLKAALTARPEPFTTSVVVTNKAPASMPARLVTVRDDGGPRLDDVRKVVSVGVNVWAASLADVSDLARMVAALLETSPGDGPVVAHLSTSGPYPVAEEATEKPHRYLSVDLSVRGEPL